MKKKIKEDDKTYRSSFPSSADFNFDYNRLLNESGDKGIATKAGVTGTPRIAIVGGGIAGLIAARELVNAGFSRGDAIHLYEASDRFGGRHVSIPKTVPDSLSTFEMGAMRFPFFEVKNGGVGTGKFNSICKYYMDLFGISSIDFPNPGAVNTGVFWNTNYWFWRPGDESNQPGIISKILCRWETFQNNLMTEDVMNSYVDFDQFYSQFWSKVITKYKHITFRQFALMEWSDAKGNDIFNLPIEKGGLGLTKTESDLLYTIGVGDGGWGAFYDICVLWVFRTMYFGYGQDLQQIVGPLDSTTKKLNPGPYYNDKTLYDDLGNRLKNPNYIGVESIDECLLYKPNANGKVPFNEIKKYTRNPVESIKIVTENYKQDQSNRKIEVTSAMLGTVEYDAVIITTPVFDLPLHIVNSSPTEPIPIMMNSGLKQGHFIMSSKIFYPLKEKYWNEDDVDGSADALPQMWSTDTICQGVYGMTGAGYKGDENKLNEIYKNDQGVIMVSYTWEDDARKMIQFEGKEKEMGEICLNRLDRLQKDTPELADKTLLSSYVDTSRAVAIHWSAKPGYAGCSKLYRADTERRNLCELGWNQEFGKETGIYFAGEAFSIEGGWTEPAARMAIDAVLHIVQNVGVPFNNDFQMTYYPKWKGVDKNMYYQEDDTPGWEPDDTITCE